MGQLRLFKSRVLKYSILRILYLAKVPIPFSTLKKYIRGWASISLRNTLRELKLAGLITAIGTSQRYKYIITSKGIERLQRYEYYINRKSLHSLLDEYLLMLYRTGGSDL